MGTLAAVDQVTISSEADGKVSRILADLGDRVKAGQPLILVDRELLIARIDAVFAEPDAFARDPQKASQLATQRRDLESALAAAEEEWLKLSHELEKA